MGEKLVNFPIRPGICEAFSAHFPRIYSDAVDLYNLYLEDATGNFVWFVPRFSQLPSVHVYFFFTVKLKFLQEHQGKTYL
jgi:hypothetical protein